MSGLSKTNTKLINIHIIVLVIFIYFSQITIADQLSPNDLEFRRQAVKRIIFDASQDIPLSSLNPAKIVGLDVMHPSIGPQTGSPKLNINDGKLTISSAAHSISTRWVGSFNPFAVYTLTVNRFNGSGLTGLTFCDSKSADNITVSLRATDGIYKSVIYSVTKNNSQADHKGFSLPEPIPADQPISLKVQMLACGANLLIEHRGMTTLIGQVDFVNHLDLRQKQLFPRYDFCLYTSLNQNSSVEITNAAAALSPGLGQADVRFITFEDGTPLLQNDRLWLTFSIRGRALPHPIQGVLSLNPSIFDIKFEGVIVFDRSDGLLRNDIASNIFYNRTENMWQGFTTGFSAYADPARKEKKEIWSIQSTNSPLKGFSIMSAKATGLIGDYEDPQCIYDTDAGKWRLLLCENHNGYKAVIRESDTWDGKYNLIAGPISVNSTGTQLQTIGGKHYALFGSADRKIHIYSYPDLKPYGELNMYLPPWDDNAGTRVWPNVVPLPDGCPAPYLALMMDRLNFPNMQGHNWTYGAMYLYYAYPTDK